MYFGIDVGGTKMIFAHYDENDQIKIIDKVLTPKSYKDFLAVIIKVFNNFKIKNNKKIKRVGIGVPGRVDDNKIVWVPNLPFLNGKRLDKDLYTQLKLDIIIANDAHLALLGETWKGIGKGRENVVLISLGTGVGGAIMAGGKIIKGNTGTAGSFGWINFNIDFETDQNHGFLDLNASGTALERDAKELNSNLTGYDIVKKAKQGEKEPLQIIDNLGDLLGASIAMISSIIDPEMVVISGGLSEIYNLFINNLQRKFKQLASFNVQDIDIVVTELKNKAAVYGAIRLAISGEKESIFDINN